MVPLHFPLTKLALAPTKPSKYASKVSKGTISIKPKLGFALRRVCPFHRTRMKYPLSLVVGADVELGIGGELDDVAAGVTRQEQADETRDASPPQFETKDGSISVAELAVKVGQNCATADILLTICRKQLSRLQFCVGVAVVVCIVVGVGRVPSFLYTSNTTSEPIPGQTITSSWRIERSLDMVPSCATLWRYMMVLFPSMNSRICAAISAIHTPRLAALAARLLELSR